MALTNRLREYRRQRGLSLRELSEAVDIDFGQLSKIENEHRGTSDERKLRLARFFGVGIEELFFVENVEKDSTEAVA